MRNSILFSLLFALVLSCARAQEGQDFTLDLAYACDDPNECVYWEQDGWMCANLYAGQHIHIGEGCFRVVNCDSALTMEDPENCGQGEDPHLEIKLEITEDIQDGVPCWSIDEIHYIQGHDSEDFPTTRKDNPVFGHFPYKFPDCDGSYCPVISNPFTFYADLASIMDAWGDDICDGFFGNILHTEVSWDDDLCNCPYDECSGETAILEGPDKFQGKRWGWMGEFFFDCDGGNDEEEPPEYCETAFAYREDGEPGQCFLNLNKDTLAYVEKPTKKDRSKLFSRWGWTQEITTAAATITEETWTIYAAAGQCDTDKGSVAGSVTVTPYYVDSDVGSEFHLNFTLVPASEWSLYNFHIYVGEEKVFYKEEYDTYTVAPGQFPHHGSATQDSLSLSFGANPADTLWVIVHVGDACSAQVTKVRYDPGSASSLSAVFALFMAGAFALFLL